LPDDQYFPLHDPLFTNVMWGVARGAVLAGLLPQLQLAATGIITQQLIAAGVPADQAQGHAAAQAQLLAEAFPSIVPEALPGLRNAVATFNLETLGFDPVANLNNAVTDLKKIEPIITETFEIGYKGIVENKLVLAADFYRTKIVDFVGPLRVETPNVFLEAASLSTALAGAFTQALQDPANAQLAAAAAALDAPSLGGNGNGSSVDELTTIFTTTAAQIPFGTMSAEQATDPAAVMLTYRNFGSVTLYGADLSFAYYPNDMWTITGNFSYVSEDLFPNLDNIGDIALNAPKQKFNLGVLCKFPNTALTVGGKVRYRGEFPMSSGVYAGPVDSYTVIDLNAAYKLPLSDDRMEVTFSVEASNVLDQGFRSFVGAPEIGRLVSGGLTVRF
jgi:iron complex outermembrane receptor protein